jgi:N-succinyldiaminopimelate aminotransferase
MTGWKIGYAVAPAPLSRAIRMSHQFVTFATATPLQHAMAEAIGRDDGYYEELREGYDRRRAVMLSALDAAGFDIIPPEGTYYVMADITPLGFDDDVAFCRWLPREHGVAAIPVSAFFHERHRGRTVVRFAFCKEIELLERAGDRLAALGRSPR